jgi:hypothetical protein
MLRPAHQSEPGGHDRLVIASRQERVSQWWIFAEEVRMIRRVAAIAALAVLMVIGSVSPARADHNTSHTIEQMTAHYQDPGLEVQNKPFALLYLRTTEGIRDAIASDAFSDPEFWDQRVAPTFASYYLDAYAAWKRGDNQDVAPAWRIAFQAHPHRLTCTQLLYLGINAHVNNDLAFVIEELGPRYTYDDHLVVDGVLAQVAYTVSPEIQRDLCPDLFTETIPAGADSDISAWRQLAWDNAQRLENAPSAKARRAVARDIEPHA